MIKNNKSDKKAKNTNNTDKRGILKPILIMFFASLGLALVLMLYFAYPGFSAKSKLNKIYNVINEGSFDYIVINQTKPFDSGTLEQMTQDFELKLSGDELQSFTEAFIKQCTVKESAGNSIEKAGFWDMRVTVFTGDTRLIFYVYDGGVYTTDKYRRFNFTGSGNELFEVTERIKEAQYK